METVEFLRTTGVPPLMMVSANGLSGDHCSLDTSPSTMLLSLTPEPGDRGKEYIVNCSLSRSTVLLLREANVLAESCPLVVKSGGIWYFSGCCKDFLGLG